MKHHISIIGKNYSEVDLEIMSNIINNTMNGIPDFFESIEEYVEDQFNIADFWVYIYNEDFIRLAECSIEIKPNNMLHIENLYVNRYCRNRNYCKLLLLNIIYFFENYNFSIEADTFNEPAFYCYKGIFGEPYKIERELAYFALGTNLSI